VGAFWFSLLLASDIQPMPLPPAAFLELETHSPVVRNGRLVEDVGIETLGGVFTVLLPRDSAVPVEKTETFSTAADNQEQIEIRLFRGVARIARENTPVGRLAVTGIPRAARGTPSVAVTFSVTADAAITVAARERAGHPIALHRRAGIDSFDCTTTDEMKRGESLRARHSGGPEGATWNWYGADLLCTVVVRGDCDGAGSAVLKLRRKPVARAAMTLSRQATTNLELRVPPKVWERALDRRKNLVYETLALSVRVDARCADGMSAFSPETWFDAFMGAFSGGE